MKNKTTRNLIVGLFIIVILLAYNYYTQPFYKFFNKKIAEYESVNVIMPTPEPTLDPRIALLNDLSSQEKIEQLIAVPYKIDSEASASTDLDTYQARAYGFYTIYGENISQEALTQELSKIKISYTDKKLLPLFATDHEGGSVQRLTGTGFTTLPAFADSCTLDQKEREALYTESAMELNKAGINIVFAPVLDIASDHKILKDRACSSYIDSRKAAEDYILSFAKYQILSVVKHFPGIGQTSQDLHKAEDEITPDRDESLSFKYIFDRYPNVGAMTAHVKLKDQLEGDWCSLSKECLVVFSTNYKDVLVFTDALDMLLKQAEPEDSLEFLKTSSKRAILAGNNVIVFGPNMSPDDIRAIVTFLTDEYTIDTAFKEKVDQSLIKIISIKDIQKS